jgi:hypothetical protein
MKSNTLTFGYGSGYCYAGSARFLHVVADTLEIARLCCCPSLMLVKKLAYKPNLKRSHFIFSR